MVTSALNSECTPYQLWYGRKPSLKHIHTFGCTVYSHIPDGNGKKLDKKAMKLIFIGCTESAQNYKVWHQAEQKSYTRHGIIFNESDFIKKSAADNRSPIEESINEDHQFFMA